MRAEDRVSIAGWPSPPSRVARRHGVAPIDLARVAKNSPILQVRLHAGRRVLECNPQVGATFYLLSATCSSCFRFVGEEVALLGIYMSLLIQTPTRIACMTETAAPIIINLVLTGDHSALPASIRIARHALISSALKKITPTIEYIIYQFNIFSHSL